MQTLVSDLRFAGRSLRKSPGFTAIALLCLALGIGANTTMFTALNSMFLRPLPFEEPERLVSVNEVFESYGYMEDEISYPNFLDWTSDSRVFASRAAMVATSFNLTGENEASEYVSGGFMSARTFDLLGVRPILGRSFPHAAEGPGREPLAIISYSLWQRRFGGGRDVLGEPILLNGDPFTIIGVMPEGFHFPERQDVWVTLTIDGTTNRGAHGYLNVARLAPGVTLEQANAALAPITARLQAEYPETNARLSATVRPFHETFAPPAEVRAIILIMLGAVGFVLLIACANIANLLLARATGRRREMAVRVAIGAGRRRIIRQLLTESLVLAILGGGLGVLVGQWGLDLVQLGITQELAYWIRFDIDRQVLLFTLGIAVATGIIFGLAPAVRASRPNLHEDLKDGGRGTSAGASRNRLRSTLVVAELALSVVLLVGAMLMMRSFLALQGADPGFDPKQILTMRLSLAGSGYAEPAQRGAFVTRLVDEIESLPGIEMAAAVNYAPLSGSSSSSLIAIEGREYPPGERPAAAYRPVTEDYFQTLRVPLIAGRYFTAQEVADTAAGPAIINDVVAKTHWPDEDPIGQRFEMFGAMRTVVGVVPETRQRALDRRSEAQVFLPYGSVATRAVTLMARTQGEPDVMTLAVRGAIERIDPSLAPYAVMSMEHMVRQSFWDRRLYGYMFAAFAGIALLLSAVGVYGVMSYSVAQRTHEIGVRMAMGAEVRDVLRLVVGQTMTLVGAGIAIGLAGAFAVTRVLGGFLYGVESTDPVSFVSIPVFLSIVAIVASFIPARRAARLSPTLSLRTE
ncbi:MAG TPA: ABC transporter permease [Gemmatimonadaceae bacterium]|nr:ABC transporter permease [Gemmatimonadaceae bacterium]